MSERANGAQTRDTARTQVHTAKRFYREATTDEREGAYHLLLDGRSARTPGRNALAVPTRALANALVEEWSAQGEFIDPSSMPFTRLANTAIDGVSAEIDAVRSDIARYAGSDLVCYRAGEPDSLVEAQSAAWDAVLSWAWEELGAQFVSSVGISFVQQPEPSLERVRAALATYTSPFTLGALHVLTTLTGSVLLALMHASGARGAEEVWRTAHVDELHQEKLWGIDSEAAFRRERRWAEFVVASRFLTLTRDDPRPS